MKKLEINNKLYQKSVKAYDFFFSTVWPILMVIGLIILGTLLVALPMLTILYLYHNSGIGLPLVIVLTVFALLIVFIVKCCKPNGLIDKTETVNDSSISVPFKLVIFQKEIMRLYEEGSEDPLAVFVNQYKLGNIPYAYDQRDDIKYIELCLAHDYQQCLIGQGVYQDIYNGLFEVPK